MKEKTFWCVVSTYDDKGRTTANIVDTIQAARKPRKTFRETRDKDIYTEWYGSLEKAKKAVEDARNA